MTITVFSQPNCQPCIATKRWLSKREIDFTERDISQDEDARTDAIDMGFTSTPIITVRNANGGLEDCWSGLNPSKLKEWAATV